MKSYDQTIKVFTKILILASPSPSNQANQLKPLLNKLLSRPNQPASRQKPLGLLASKQFRLSRFQRTWLIGIDDQALRFLEFSQRSDEPAMGPEDPSPQAEDGDDADGDDGVVYGLRRDWVCRWQAVVS